MSDVLLSQGFDLMIFGMGTVFAFLTILVISTRSMSALIANVFPEPPEPEIKSVKAVVSSSAPVEPRVLAVLQAAVCHYPCN